MGFGTEYDDEVLPKGLNEGPRVAGMVCRVPAGEVDFPAGAVEGFFSFQWFLQNVIAFLLLLM